MASNEEEDGSSDRDKEIALHSLQSANACLECNNYGRAFAHYLVVLKLYPSKKAEIKESFSLALREWGEQLERQGRIEDLFQCYEQACDLFPECETMLNNMGAQLFRLGYIDEAACFLRRSLKLDPDYLGARENLENVCGHLVERWHFRMLNDRVRNEAYRGAITAAIRAGYDTVLDIGTGTGLLSMFAAEAGAKSIYGCDMSKTMYEMSCDVIYTNQMADQINLIHSKSTDLKIPDNIPEKVSLVVTEVFDAGLLGEGVMNTLYHAWKNLMQPRPLARVIPKGATLFVCAIESDSIRSQNRFLYPGVQHLDFQDINIVCKTSHNHICAEFEPYTSEWLDQVPGGCKLLTLPVPFMDVDLSDPQSMEKYLVGFTQEFSLTVSVNGRFDAIATWFDLHLDCDHSVTSAPGSGSCWEQGIYPILPGQLNTGETDNLLVRESDTITLKCFYRSDSIKFKCTKITRNSTTTTNTNAATMPNSLSHTSNKIIPPSAATILNNHQITAPLIMATTASSSPPTLQTENLSLSSIKHHHRPPTLSMIPTTTTITAATASNITRQSNNVLVEPIHQQTSSFYNGNYGDLEFGTVGDMSSGVFQQHNHQDQEGGRIRHVSSDSVEEHHAHLENQCIEIIESVMNGESPPSSDEHCYLNSYNTHHQSLAAPPPQYSDLNFSSSNAVATTSHHSTQSSVSVSMVDNFHILYGNSQYYTNCGLSEDRDVNLASASIQSLSFGNAATTNTTGNSYCDTDSTGLNLENGKSLDLLHHSLKTVTTTTDNDSATTTSSSTIDDDDDHDDDENDDDDNLNNAHTFYLSREELLKLNDLHYNRSICAALQHVKARVKPSKFRIMTYTDGVPVLGLQALKLGATEVCMLDSDVHQPLIYAIAAANDIPTNKFMFAGTDELEMFDNNWGIMLAELVDESGCLQQRILEDIALARATCLSPNAIVMPGKVTIQAMMIESHSLRVDSMVTSDNNTLGYLVAGFMNDFQMTTHPGINFSMLEHKALTHPFELLTFDLNEFNLGQIPSYLDQSQSTTITAVETGTIHAILYWFDLELTSKVKVSTLDSKYHWKQAAILQKNPLTVSTGSPLRVDSMCRNSCIHAELSMN